MCLITSRNCLPFARIWVRFWFLVRCVWDIFSVFCVLFVLLCVSSFCVSCTQCCLYLWIVYSWSTIQFSMLPVSSALSILDRPFGFQCCLCLHCLFLISHSVFNVACVFCIVYSWSAIRFSMLPVSLHCIFLIGHSVFNVACVSHCLFLIGHSVFSNVYLL